MPVPLHSRPVLLTVVCLICWYATVNEASEVRLLVQAVAHSERLNAVLARIVSTDLTSAVPCNILD